MGKVLDRFDFLMILCVTLLSAAGVAFIYSSGMNDMRTEYVRQIVWFGTGLAVMLAFALIDYRKLARHARTAFLVICGLLVLTRLFGRPVNGAISWLGIGSLGIQPSEFSKIVYIIFLARFLERSQNQGDGARFFKALGITLVPMALILAQPDLGTASVFVPVFMVMCFMAGIRMRFILIFFSCGMLSVVFACLPFWESEIYRGSISMMQLLSRPRLKMLVTLFFAVMTIVSVLGNIYFEKRYFYWMAVVFGVLTFALLASTGVGKVLKDYQIKRLLVFIDPSIDRLGAGWNISNSKIAIGSGGLWGRGFLQGPQSHGRFVPQQTTDFIFSIFAEETGFVGCAAVFVLYVLLMARILFIMRACPTEFGTYICAGGLGMMFFHFVVNVGMVMGMMPITGIPLLFLSYGGSSLITAMCVVGIVMSVRSRRLEF